MINMALSPPGTKLAVSIFFVLWGYCSISGAMSRPIDPYDKTFFIQKHAEWMAEHDIIYFDAVEQNKRLDIFTENYLFIEKHNNERKKSFKLSLNKFADLSNDEFVSSHRGLMLPNSTGPTATETFRYGKLSLDELPPYVDWRERGVLTDVKDQGHCGCCWSFASTGAVEAIVKIKTGQTFSLSEQQLLDCVPNTYKCHGGAPEYAFDYIKENGIATEDDYTYQGRVGYCDPGLVSKPATQISGFQYVPFLSEQELLKAVSMQPVLVEIDITGGEFMFYSDGIFDYQSCGISQYSHAVLVTGYGETENGMKYWLIKNSWSTDWGEDGYMRLQRNVGFPQGACGITRRPFFPYIN